MPTARIAIVGAGLSGLYAAFLLERQGIGDYVLLEARDAPGGRIASVSSAGHQASATAVSADGIDRFDLGPTWFWPELQPQLDRLVRDLGLHGFEQHETGDMLVEHAAHAPPMRRRGFRNMPSSMRLVGGMDALIGALYRRLDAARIVTGQTVRRLRCTGARIELDSEDASGQCTSWCVEQVLLALPPRLAEHNIAFTPALPLPLTRQWRATATWMAPHAKYLAIYDSPFWREQGLSGNARSMLGPLGEIHDASVPGGSAALFGFFAWPAHTRQGMPDEVLRSHCRAQLARLFGLPAGTPKAEASKDWAQDPYTATAADPGGAGLHAEAPAATVASGPWHGRLTGIASEWSASFPGYLAGAVEAAHRGVAALLAPSDDPAPPPQDTHRRCT